MTKHKEVIIIGSGFGGLSAGIRLQNKGYSVTILEKNATIGGHASQHQEKGYTFDLGPSIITAPDLIGDIFTVADKKMEDYLSLTKLDPFYRIYFHDGTTFDYSDNAQLMEEQLARFDPHDATQYKVFLDYSRQLYDAVMVQKMGAKTFTTVSDLLSFLPTVLKLQAFRSSYSMASRFFRDERSRFSFSFHPLFLGGSPFSSPAVFQMIPYLEKKEGVWFSKGGMYSLVQALEKIFIESGGIIKTNHEVSKITIEKAKAIGVHSNGRFFPADIVVSNAHFAHTYKDLIDPSHRKKWTNAKINKLSYSMSTVLLYMGVKKKYPNIPHHSIILSHRYKGLIDDIFVNKHLSDDFSIYMHIPTRTDQSMAPAGSESIYALVPVPNLLASVDWPSTKETFTKRILDYLQHDFGMEGLQENLEVLKIYTPDDFSRERNNYLGAAWSVEPKLTQIANFRPHNKSEEFDNIYLVGASTHPGAGLPGVLLSAEATVNSILINDPR